MKYNFILGFIGNVKRERKLPYTAQALGSFLDKIIDLTILIKTKEKTYKLADGYQSKYNESYNKSKK